MVKSLEKGSRNKNIYEITDQGKEELGEWLANHQYSIIYRDELLLKLFVSKKKDYQAILIDLKNVLGELLAQQEVYLEMEKSSLIQKSLSYVLVLEYEIKQNNVTIKWFEDAIKRIEEHL
ncbi:MAG TPA: hypothetical protein GXZ51_00355 [Acholeplasma sp.]|nr:hypothetical protein [Acholeplasma sp.]